jgi:serpin B
MVREQINSWVVEVTRNLITEVIDPNSGSPTTVHVVANAIYFEGEWCYPFEKENTVDEEFHRLGHRSPVEVPFLRSWCDQWVACHDGFKVLKLPYQVSNAASWELYWSQPKFAMCVFLPDDRDGLRGLVEKIASSSPRFLHDHLPTESVPVGVFRLPKFKLTFDSTVRPFLEELGLRLPFDAAMADMSGMLMEGDTRAMYINNVVHKAVIEMNEEGSEAAAVTVEMDDLGFSLFGDDDSPPPPEPVDFVADHPFAFFIIEETSGSIVFVGHVLDPSEE